MNLNLPNLKQIKIGKSFLIPIAAIIIFSMVVYSYLFGLEVAKEDIPNYFELTANPYQKFEKNISSNEIKNLTESGQFKNIEYYEDTIKEKDYPKVENPFEKTF